MADGTTVCPGCGKAAAGAASASVPAGSGLQDNVAGMLAYFTIIPAIVFLVLEPYNRNKFVRFHSFQCLFLAGALIVIHIVLGLIPFLGWIISVLLSLATVILWVLLVVKAYQGQKFKLPFIGDLAEQQA
ncbi:MAG TPA: DUF4870 domain-containing protein [Terriglobales bacterium]|nr:DUF4870 domain-containing protein [Terriglobales bacterium]